MIEGISGADNASAGGETRLVITLKRDANANVILNNLYKHTPMQVNFAVNTVALVDGVPRTLDLSQLVQSLHRPPDRGRHKALGIPAGKARAELHIIEGLLRAIDMLDAVIAAIRNSDDRAAAKSSLMSEPFSFSEIQANHILDMTLARLTRLGRSNLEEEHAKLLIDDRRAGVDPG